MTKFQSSIIHLATVVVVITTVTILLITGHIDQQTGVGLIGATAGVGLGTGAVSLGGATAVPSTSSTGVSSGATTAPTA